MITDINIDTTISNNVNFQTDDPLNNYIFNKNIYPNINASNNNDLNIILENSVLKRACCLRQNSDSNSQSVNINYIDNGNKVSKSFVINDLNNLCKNLTYIDNNNVKLTDNFIPQSPACDNFYKTYCKTLAGFNQDNIQNTSNDDNNYNLLVKYSSYNNTTSGLECSCINSPFLNLNNDKDKIFSESTIFHQDKYCRAPGNIYMTKDTKNSKNKSYTLNLCVQNIGSNLQSNMADSFKADIKSNTSICNINNTSDNSKPNNTTETGNLSNSISNTTKSNTTTTDTTKPTSTTTNTTKSTSTATDTAKSTSTATDTAKSTSTATDKAKSTSTATDTEKSNTTETDTKTLDNNQIDANTLASIIIIFIFFIILIFIIKIIMKK